MKVAWGDEAAELPFGFVVLGVCAIIATLILWG